MIKNIPNRFNSENILALINSEPNSMEGLYDWFYLPEAASGSGNNAGYAFINFVNPTLVVRLFEKFHGLVWAHAVQGC
jgi:hypothetical protein